jgi:aldehyde dehydrogenase (NAD+)
MHETQFYIDGAWVDPIAPKAFDVIDPATEESFAQISLGSAADVDRAVRAARRAFPAFAVTSRQDRLELLRRILKAFEARREDLARAISREMGAPYKFALSAQVGSGPNHLNEMIRVLESFAFDAQRRTTIIANEPNGVCGLRTPGNRPNNQNVSK